MADKWYKFTSPKGADNAVELLVVEGSYAEPEKSISVGQCGQLSDEELANFRAHANLREVDDLEGEILGLGYEAPEGAKAKNAKSEPKGEQAPTTRGDETNVTGKEV